MIKPVFLMFSVFAIFFRSYTFEVSLTGHLRSSTKRIHSKNGNVEVFVTGDNKLLGRSNTDANGDFNLFFVTDKEKIYCFYAVLPGRDTVFLKSVISFLSQEPEITFYLPNPKHRRHR